MKQIIFLIKTKKIDNMIEKITSLLDFYGQIIFYEVFGFPLITIILLSSSLFFSFYLGFPAIKLFKNSLKTLTKNNNTNNTILNSKQSLLTSFSTIFGLGSIAGIGTGIYMGGAGAIFWLVITTIFAMNLSFAEVFLAKKFKNQNIEDKSIECAPIRYIKDSLKEINLLKFGIILSTIYAFLYFFGLLSIQMYQVKEATNVITEISFFKGKELYIIILMEILLISATYKGITGLSKIFEKLMPIIFLLFLLSISIVLLVNITNIPKAILTIITEAFKIDSITGGIVASVSSGVRRLFFSAEAGLGSSTTPLAASNTDNIIEESAKATLSPFFVAMLCLITGLAIISSGVYNPETNTLNGILLLKHAFDSVSPILSYILTIVVIMLSFTVTAGITFNAQNIYNYTFGKKTTIIFIIIHFICSLMTIYLNLTKVVNIGDTFYLSLAIPNIICIFLTRKIIKQETKIN